MSGVPQGSVFRPLLFLVNEVTNQVSDGSNTVLFADYIALYRAVTSSDDYAQLQSDIDSIADWVKGNQLKFVDQYKYLGLIFYPNLSWSEHINSICNKVRRLIGLFYRKFYKF